MTEYFDLGDFHHLRYSKYFLAFAIENTMGLQESIYEIIFDLSPRVKDAGVYRQLQTYTARLMDMYMEQGRIKNDPFESVWQRNLSLPVNLTFELLHKSTCLITGGLGCVGSELVSQLLKYDVDRIIIVDIADTPNLTCCSERLIHFHCDIRDYSTLVKIFKFYRPDFVFHTAGQRDPGYAEIHVIETIQTNIFGTLNVVLACEETSSVQQCVFTSTGKASRYYTDEMYAASKKIGEFIFDAYSEASSVKYSMVRFTHILNNSLMHQQLRYASRFGEWVPVHCPAKYVTAQNVTEAALLMLNALHFSQAHKSRFLIVKNLEWPVESLEVALFELKQSKRELPIVFLGNPKGYCEKFFRGQLNWATPDELNLLLNVYEHRVRKINDEDDIIISTIVGCDRSILDDTLATLSRAITDHECRQMLQSGLKRIVQDSLTRVHEEDTVDILEWGLDKNALNESANSTDFDTITALLSQSLRMTAQGSVVRDQNPSEILIKN